MNNFNKPFPRVEKVILTQVSRGSGKGISDPCRSVLQAHHQDGTFIAEHDPCIDIAALDERVKRAEVLLNRVLTCDRNAKVLNGAGDLRESIEQFFDPKPL